MTTKKQLESLVTVFMIEHGEYSDYSVDGVFEDRETAQTWADKMNGDSDKNTCYDYEVREIALVRKGTEPFKVTHWRKEAILWDNGNIADEKTWAVTEWAIERNSLPPRRPFVRYVRAPYYEQMGGGGRIEVHGNSEKAVAKVFGEKVAMWKAGAWGGPKVGDEELTEGG